MKSTGITPPKKSATISPVAKIIAVLICVELTLQVVSLTRYLYWRVYENKEALGLVSGNWFYKNPDNKWWIEESPQLEAEYHPLLSFIPKPLHTPNIEIDGQGVRKTVGNPTDTSASHTKIFIFGGSTVFGTNAKNEETIPSLISQTLNAENPEYEITNYGVSAYNSSQELAYLLLQLKQNNIPDVVVFYDGVNDLYSRYLYTYTPDNQSMYEDVMRKKLGNIWKFHVPLANQSLFDPQLLMSQLALFTTRIKLIDYPLKLISSFGLGARMPNDNLIKFNHSASIPDETAKMYAENVKMVRVLGAAYGFKTLFIWQPSIATKQLTDNEIEIQNSKTEAANLYRETTTRVDSMNIPDFHNLSTIFSNDRRAVYLDFVHVSAEGNKTIAEKISALIAGSFD